MSRKGTFNIAGGITLRLHFHIQLAQKVYMVGRIFLYFLNVPWEIRPLLLESLFISPLNSAAFVSIMHLWDEQHNCISLGT